MLALTRLPSNVRYVLRGPQQFFHFRHHLIFSWVLVLLLVYPDKATLQGLVRLGPKHVCEWHLRRFLCASYWCWRMVLGWLVEAVLAVLPPAADGRVLLVRVVDQGTQGRDRLRPSAGDQTPPTGRTLGGAVGDGLSAADPGGLSRYSSQGAVECLYLEAKFRLADRPTTTRTYPTLENEKGRLIEKTRRF